jgi:RimJ/RimL family protein N-acetyltransferase
MGAILETDRLLLRTFTLEDAAGVLVLSSDPEVMRFLSPPLDQTVADAEKRVRRAMDHHARRGFGLNAVVEKATGTVLGSCGVKELEEGPHIEIGYHFRRDAWGKGYATEAARACLRHAFEHLGLTRIVGVVNPLNLASKRVLEKIGLTYEGHGFYYKTDVLVYAAERAPV